MREQAWLRLEGGCGYEGFAIVWVRVWPPKGYDWVYERFVETGSEGYRDDQAGR